MSMYRQPDGVFFGVPLDVWFPTIFLLLLSWYLSCNNNIKDVINGRVCIGIFPGPCSMYGLYVSAEVPGI